MNQEQVKNPDHYGGQENPFEAINIIEAYNLDFVEGNIIKYVLRYKKKNGLVDLKKAQWYLDRKINQLENNKKESHEK